MTSAEEKNGALLPIEAEVLLRDWPIPTRSDEDWEAFATAILDRFGESESMGHEPEAEWLFKPPLPLQGGESRQLRLMAPVISLSDVRQNRRELTRPGRQPLAGSGEPSLTELATHALRVDPAAAAHDARGARPGAGSLPSARKHVASTAEHTAHDQAVESPPTSATSPEQTGIPRGEASSTEVGFDRRTSRSWWWFGSVVAAAALLILVGKLGAPARYAEDHLPLKTGPAPLAATSTQVAAQARPREDVSPLRSGAAEPIASARETPPPSSRPPSSRNSPLRGALRESSGKTSPSLVKRSPAVPLARSNAGSAERRAARPLLTTGAPTENDNKDPAERQDGVAAITATENARDLSWATPPMVPAAGDKGAPDRPSIGAAQGAIGAVLGAARLCLAGQPKPSRATVLFGSNGRVQRVDVEGPAAGTPAEGCVRRAMSQARVRPFGDESFSIRTTVRP